MMDLKTGVPLGEPSVVEYSGPDRSEIHYSTVFCGRVETNTIKEGFDTKFPWYDGRMLNTALFLPSCDGRYIRLS
jgi:hypothetical protein